MIPFKAAKYCIPIILAFFIMLGIGSCRKKDKTEVQNTGGTFPIDTISLKIDELSSKILKSPAAHAYYFQRAKLYQVQNKLVLAIKDMQTALRIDSSRYMYYDFYGDLCLKADGVTPALEAYKKSIKLKPQNEYAYLKMGEIYLYLSDRENSFQSLNEALRINKYNGKAYFFKAYNYLEMGDTAKAISNFQTSVDVNPDLYESYINLGLIYAKRRDKKAVFYYESCLRLKPGTTEVLFNLGKYYQDVDSFEKSISYYTQLMEAIPDHPGANYNLGYIYFINRDFEKAIGYFSKNIIKVPSNKDAWFSRGQCYKFLKRNNEAVADFKKVLELNPGNKPALSELKSMGK